MELWRDSSNTYQQQRPIEDLSLYEGRDNLVAMRAAINYNAFLAELLVRFTASSSRSTVIDFGAGLGDFARAVRTTGAQIICVEPDDDMRSSISSDGLRAVASIDDVADWTTDYLYSLNVLEHIGDDQKALISIRRKMRQGGRVLIYVPAFMALFTSMDRRVGHFRRYEKKGLQAKMETAGLQVISARYVDSLGFFATLVFRLIGSANGELSPRSVAIYDRVVFPLSRLIDRFTGRWFGKNLLMIAEASPHTDQ